MSFNQNTLLKHGKRKQKTPNYINMHGKREVSHNNITAQYKRSKPKLYHYTAEGKLQLYHYAIEREVDANYTTMAGGK